MSLEVYCEEHLKEVREFASAWEIRDDLEEHLEILSNFYSGKGICRLSKDFAPHSFSKDQHNPQTALLRLFRFQ